jgi:hypothetical protein
MMNLFDPQKSGGAGSRLSRPTAASLAKVSVSQTAFMFLLIIFTFHIIPDQAANPVLKLGRVEGRGPIRSGSTRQKARKF